MLFPPTLATNLDNILGTQYLTLVPIKDSISKDEVIKVINYPVANKAPGVSGIPNRFLRSVAPQVIDSLTRLFQAYFNLRYHPKLFKKVNTVILKKLNRSNYLEPKAYRPITLLDTLGKALKIVISRRLTGLAESHNLLP